MKTYVVSGAGSGIGRAIAQKISENGFNLILLGRDIAKLNATLDLLAKGEHRVLTANICDKTDLYKVIESLKHITIDGIIANAGIGGENNWGEDDRWGDIINTNLTGTYNFVNSFLPLLKQNKGAKHILITSSVLARLGVANYTAYCASKAGLLGLMRSWAVELATQDILVNAICPGWVDTEMAQQGLQGIADNLGMPKSEFYNIAMQSVPLRRMSKPDEIADLVYYLLNQQSITGQAIDINCGSVMNS